MIPILRSWVDRYFHNEEAVLVVVLLLVSFAVLWVLGNELGPVIAAIIIAFLMQGIVTWLTSKGISHIRSQLYFFLQVIFKIFSYNY